MVAVEVCVDGPEGLAAALRGGADRIEICQALPVGGLTPSAGLMALAAGAGRPVHALIRPRAGDFRYTSPEGDAMCHDIAAARAAGLQGLVLGALNDSSDLDLPLLRTLVRAAGEMSLTLSRAFDLVDDRDLALEQAIDLGFARILTSGGAPTAEAGLNAIAQLIDRARDRIVVLPAGGITAANAARFVAAGAREVHASCSRRLPADPRLRAFGFAAEDQRATDEGLVRALKAAV
jgi:copper homeostasis protein